MVMEEIEDFSALWVGRAILSGIAGTGGTSSGGKNDEGYRPKGSGESGIIGDPEDRGYWRGGYKFSSSRGIGSGFSETGGDFFFSGDGFCSCTETPFDARCSVIERLASVWESRIADGKVEGEAVGHAISSDRPALKHAVRLFITVIKGR